MDGNNNMDIYIYWMFYSLHVPHLFIAFIYILCVVSTCIQNYSTAKRHVFYRPAGRRIILTFTITAPEVGPSSSATDSGWSPKISRLVW